MAAHKCKVPDPPADTGRWLGTYGDMVTLLMAFFVMLFAVSETNAQKFNAFVSGLAGPFDNQAMSMGLIAGGADSDAYVNPIGMIAPKESVGAEILAGSEAGNPSGNGEEGQGVGRETPADAQLAEVEAQVEQVLEGTAVPISADVRDDERGLVVAISTDEVLFEVGSAVLSPVGEQLLGEIAPILVGAPNSIVVEGHTDDQPLSRAGYTNWNLSTDRAVAVVQLLGQRHGLPFQRISAGGYAEHRPLVPNDGPENRAKNRRVEILIVALDVAPGDAPAPPAGVPAPPVLDFSEPLPAGHAGAAPDGAQAAAAAAPRPGATPVAAILGQ